MIYFLGILTTFLLTTFEANEPPKDNREWSFRLCASLVWPVLLVCLVFHWKDEIVAKVVELLAALDLDLSAYYQIAKDILVDSKLEDYAKVLQDVATSPAVEDLKDWIKRT